MPVSTKSIAKQKGRTDDDIMKLVKAHEAELNRMGSKVKYVNVKVQTKGGPQTSHQAHLNDQQANFIRKLKQERWEGK